MTIKLSNSVLNRLKKLKFVLSYRLYPKAVDALVVVLTLKASWKLRVLGEKGILVDTNLFNHAISFRSCWVDTGEKKLGKAKTSTGYLAKYPKYPDDLDDKISRSSRYIAAIASLARRGHLKLMTSDELEDEKWTHPVGKFRDSNLGAYSLLKGVKITKIRDPQYSLNFGTWSHHVDPRQARKRRLENKSDSLYQELAPIFGKKGTQDAWHLVTAERNGCYCFLTMDFRIKKTMDAQRGNKAVQSLSVKVMSPEEFAKAFSIPKISANLFAYHEAVFFKLVVASG